MFSGLKKHSHRNEKLPRATQHQTAVGGRKNLGPGREANRSSLRNRERMEKTRPERPACARDGGPRRGRRGRAERIFGETMGKNLPSLKRSHLYKQEAQQSPSSTDNESLTRQALVTSRTVKAGHLGSREPSSVCRGVFLSKADSCLLAWDPGA